MRNMPIPVKFIICEPPISQPYQTEGILLQQK